MSTRYKLTHEKEALEISNDTLDKVSLIKSEDDSYHLIIDQKSVKVIVQMITDKSITILLDGKKYQFRIENELDLLVQELGFSSTSTKKVSAVSAPMPGLVLDIMVSEGDNIKQGEPLLILEAMKMENVIKAENDVTIKEIHVTPKQAVEKNQLLIEFE